MRGSRVTPGLVFEARRSPFMAAMHLQQSAGSFYLEPAGSVFRTVELLRCTNVDGHRLAWPRRHLDRVRLSSSEVLCDGLRWIEALVLLQVKYCWTILHESDCLLIYESNVW